MIRIELDAAHPSALVYQAPGAQATIQAPGSTKQLLSPANACWSYATYDGETGLNLIHGSGRSFFIRARAVSAAEAGLLGRAAEAIVKADMPAARIRWEYRDRDGVRALSPVDWYLPLQGADAGAADAPCPSIEEARGAGRHGWNLRCNRCGGYGASWIPGERPGWGSLALCPPHHRELAAEHSRHRSALVRVRAVCFEQPPHTHT